MPGGGVNEKNISELMHKTKATECHSSAKTFIPSNMQFSEQKIQMGSKSSDENKVVSVDENRIKNMLKKTLLLTIL